MLINKLIKGKGTQYMKLTLKVVQEKNKGACKHAKR